MSEETKTVLLQVKIDEQAANKKLQELSKQIEYNKRAQAALNKEIKASDIITDEQAKRQQILQNEYKALTSDVKLHTSALDAQRKADTAKNGSILQLREQLKTLTTQWNSLSEEERNNAEIGGQIEKATRATSDKLKELEGKVGDTRRNVGNYTQSLLEASDGSGKLSQTLSVLQETYDQLKDFVGQAKEAIMAEAEAKLAAKQATVASNAATTAGTAATGAHTAVTNVSKAAIIGQVGALKLLKFALAATGIGAILLLLGGLISFLTRTQEGMDKVSRVTAGFGAVMGVLMDKLSSVGKAIFDFVGSFENFGDAIKKIGQLLLDNLISRLKGFGVILTAIMERDLTKLQDGFTQVATGITDATAKTKKFAAEMQAAAKAGAAIEAENQRILKAERALQQQRKQANAEIEKNKMLSDDVNKSTQERIKAAQKAYSLEQKFVSQEVKLQQQKIANLNKEQALRAITNADRDKLAEEEGKLADLQQGSYTRQTELQNKLNGLRKEGADKAAAAVKELSEKEYEALQKRLADEKAALELRVLQTKEGTDERLEAEIDVAEKELQIALSAKGVTENQKKLLQAKFDSDEISARKAHALHLLELAREQAEAFKAAKQKEYRESQDLTDEYFAQERLKSTESYADSEGNLWQHRTRMQELERLALETALQNAKDYGQSTLEIEQQLADLKIETRQREADTKLAIAEVEYNTAVTMLQATMDLANIIGASSSELATFQKMITLFQLGVDTAKAISAITASAATVAANIAASSGPAGIVTGPLAYAAYYATNVATVLANIAQAKQLLSGDAPEAPKFATGGILAGPSHAQGGIDLKVRGKVVANAEGGEPILTKNVSRNPMLLAAASAINVAAGGRPLVLSTYNAQGGILPGTTRDFLTGNAGEVIDYNKMAEAVSKVQVNADIRDIKKADSKFGAKMKITNQ